MRKRPKFYAVDSLASDVPTKVGLTLAHKSNFGRMPFLPPPVTQQWPTEMNPGSLGVSPPP